LRGSDPSTYLGKNPMATYPRIPAAYTKIMIAFDESGCAAGDSGAQDARVVFPKGKPHCTILFMQQSL
jgi:hypothetical protein